MANIQNNSLIRCYPSDLANGHFTVPNGVRTIQEDAFSPCANLLKSITMPNSLKGIGADAFSGCRFTSVTIPNGVEWIGWGVFDHCTGLKSITIPSSVTSIQMDAFLECTNVERVILDKSTANIPGADGLTLLDRVIRSHAPSNFIKAMIDAGASFTDNGLARITDNTLRAQVIAWAKEHQRATLYERAFQIFYAHQCETAGYAEPTNVSSLPNELWFQILGLDANSHPEFPLLQKADLQGVAKQAVAAASARRHERPFKESLLYGYNQTLRYLSQLGQKQADDAKWHDWKQAGGSTAIVLKPQ